MILKKDGSVWSTAITSGVFGKHFALAIPRDAKYVAAGAGFSMVIKRGGSVWGIGRNHKGQLGDGTKCKRGTFCFVQVIVGAEVIAAPVIIAWY